MEKWERAAALILTTLLLASLFFNLIQRNSIIELDQRYQELATEHDSKTTELDLLESKLNETEETLKQLNKTLTTLETIPMVKAANMIISQVGLSYFNQYFHDPRIQTPEYNPNITIVTYKYDIQVENYSTRKTVSFQFYPRFVLSYGVPVEENLQPFTITAEEAKEMAVNAGLPDGPYELETEIVYTGPADVYPLTGHEEKYVWRVRSWTDQVYTINHGGRVLHFDDVDTREEALSQGVHGYVKLGYPDLPRTINLTDTVKMAFTLNVSFVSYEENLTEAKITVDPFNTDTYWLHSATSEELRDYLTYEPSGTFILKEGEALSINCTLYAPDLDEELSFSSKYALNGIGISAEKTLIVSDLRTRLHKDVWERDIDFPSPNVHDPPEEDRVNLIEWFAIAREVQMLLDTGELPYLEEIYVTRHPDWLNGTAYISLTIVSPETTQPILDRIEPNLHDYVRFVEAPAPMWLLQVWERRLMDILVDELPGKGVHGTCFSHYYDGRFLVGFEELDEEKIVMIRETIEGRVPSGMLVVFVTGPIVLD